MKMEVVQRETRFSLLARQFVPPRQEIKRVSRCLFGPSNHIDSISFAKRELLHHRITETRRWNFDFENEKPLQGKFDWEKVDENLNPRKRHHEDEEEVNQVPKELRLDTAGLSQTEAPVLSPKKQSCENIQPKKKTKISDYFPTTKKAQQHLLKKTEPSEPSHQTHKVLSV